MRRWVWRLLLMAAAVLALTGTALAADLTSPVVVDGFELTLNASKTGWTVTGFDGKEEEVVIPSLYKNKPVTAIAASAFVVNPADPPEKQLTKITISGTVKTVGEDAFKGCASLNTVTFEDYINAKGDVERGATIGESAFENCTALENLTLSSNTLSIGANAFKGCSRLPSVVIPKFVDTISAGAFTDCSNLKEITFLDTATKFTGAFGSLTGMRRIHCPGNSTVYNNISAELGKTKTERIVHMISDVKTEATTKASCTSAGGVQVSFTCPPVVKEVSGTDADGNPTTSTVTTPCDTYSNGKYEESRTTSILPHTEGQPSSKESTCVEYGYEDKIDCTVCGTELSSTELPLIDHNYDEDAGVEEEPLFPGRCDGTLGLSMVTRKCAVCGYTPVCFTCEELKLALEEADAKLEEARKELTEATAKLEAAAAAKERAEAAKEAADEALAAAEKAKTEAESAYTEAQGKTAEAQTALDAAATDAEKEAAQKVLDAAKAKEEEAKRASQAADRAVLEREIAQEEAQEALAEAEAAYTTAEAEKTDAEGAVNNTAVSTAQGDLRTHLMGTTTHTECAECLKLLGDIREAKSASAKEKAKGAYTAHQGDSNAHKPVSIPAGAISGNEADGAPEHDWGEPEVPKDVQRPVCGSGSSIKVVPTYTCKVCGATKTGKAEILDAAPEHKLPAKPEIDPSSKPATCTEDGKTVYKDYTCETCNTLVKGEERTIPASGHKWVDKPELDETIRQPSCVDGGLKNTYQVCENENCPLKGAPQLKESVPVEPDPKGHLWGDFVPDEGQDMTPNETCEEKKVTGTVTCTREGCPEKPTERRELTIEGLGRHTWGEWKAGEDGKEIRECSVCGKTEERTPPENPEDPDEPEDPDDPDKPTDPTPPEESTYKVDVIQASNGTTSVDRSTAKAGDQVTITVTPNSGYVLDMIRIIGDSRTLSYTDLGGGRYRFTMPAANVEIRVTYDRAGSDYGSNWTDGFGNSGSGDRSDPRRTSDVIPVQIQEPVVGSAGADEQVFQDIPTTHWAAGEINWASQMGYMNGSNGRFNPSGNISQQQMWMVLARLTGEQPASMEEARRWAELGGFADGSSPTGPVKRYQLVTALYRCARLTGRASRTTASLAGYPDSRTVPTVAREAFTWALTNGIVSGDAEGRLKPSQIITRDQFAVILYRYSHRI